MGIQNAHISNESAGQFFLLTHILFIYLLNGIQPNSLYLLFLEIVSTNGPFKFIIHPMECVNFRFENLTLNPFKDL